MKQTLCMILKGYPRISESFISGEIALLERQGLNVRIFSMRSPREKFAHKSVKEIRAGVVYLPEELFPNLHRLLWRALRFGLRRPERFQAGLGELAARTAESGRPLLTLKHFLQACWIAEALAAAPASEEKPAHLHAHFAHSPTSVALFASVLTGLPFSFTAHAKDIWSQEPAKLARKLARARFVVTCTEYNRRFLESLNERGTPLFRVYHGVDLSHFSLQGRPDRASQPYAILTVARLTPKKGLVTGLRALKILADEGVNFRYRLVGDGEQEAELKTLVQKLGLDDRVRFLGTLTHDEVLGELAQADVFVLPCEVTENGDRDGVPNVLVEALACGTPVVSTAVSAVPELIQDGLEGLLVPEKRPRELAGAMRRMLEDEELRGRVRLAGREKVEALFDSSRNCLTLAEIFRQRAGLGGEASTAEAGRSGQVGQVGQTVQTGQTGRGVAGEAAGPKPTDLKGVDDDALGQGTVR